MNYSKHVTKRPQTKPILGRTDMVKNNAGGYVFEITPKERLERFLLIGSEGGTYYVSEQKLTEENAKSIIGYLKTNGKDVLDTIQNFVDNRRAPKLDAILFTLSLACTHGDSETKIRAYSMISTVCKTSTHLFMFLANIQNMRGWSNGLRKGVAKFYTGRTEDQIAYQVVKYRERLGFTHKDALRLCHAKASTDGINHIFKYATFERADEKTDLGSLHPYHPLIQAFEKAQDPDISTKDLVQLIEENGLTWEMIPTERLNDPKLLNALIPHMPLVALIRNLNRFSYNGLTANNETVKSIVGKLTDENLVKKTGIHPINVINYMYTYSSGKGNKGSKTWKVSQKIVDALCDTYSLSLSNITPSNKKILVGVDISGSMGSLAGSTQMTCAQVANVWALTMLKSEPNVEVVQFDDSLHEPKYGKRSSVDTVLNGNYNGGATDCALPLVHAVKNTALYDAIIILTDNETWAGPRHGIEVLDLYRKEINRDVKVIEIAMVANQFSNYPSDDKNLLRIVGFDSTVIELINSYLK